VNGFPVFLVYILFHFMAGDTEVQGIGRLHRGIETTPEDYADDHEKDGRAEGGP
jgi:hypothetical protein